MKKFESSVERLREIFDKVRLVETLSIRTVLLVLDDDKEKEAFIFSLVKLLSVRLKTSFIFLLAVRGYLAQAKAANISLESLPQLLAKIKKEFEQQEDLFDIAFLTDEEIPPYERIEELLRKRRIDLIVIPAPYTSFAKEEIPTTKSLGITIDRLIEQSITQYKIPLLLIQSTERFEPPFDRIKLLFRSSTIRNDILGWFLALGKTDASVDIYNTELEESDLERVTLYNQLLVDWVTKEKKSLIITHKQPSTSLNEFCSQRPLEAKTLVVLQELQEPVDDFRFLITALTCQRSDTLIFPPESEKKMADSY